MVRLNEIRTSEFAVVLLSASDAGLIYIGTFRASWTERLACPRQGRPKGRVCGLEIAPHFALAVAGLEQY